MKLEATYEKGVFVPAEPPLLAENERVHLTVEPVHAANPVASVETIRLRRERRIMLDPELAQHIALSAELHPDEF